MPYSMACGTPLSNFEAGLNYKDVSDPAVTGNKRINAKEEQSVTRLNGHFTF